MMVDPVGLGSALAALSPATNKVASEAASAANTVNPGSFAEMLADAGKNAVHQLENAETMAVRGIHGDVGPREVADAVMSAEQTLNAAIAIRDKLVAAYLEVSRMTI